VPLCTGWEVTLIEHEALGASVAGQLFVCVKAIAPAVAIDEIVSTESPVLDSVSTCGGLVVPVRCIANVSEVGEKEPTGAIPVPESATVWFVAGTPT
jgi:hypothetical protein